MDRTQNPELPNNTSVSAKRPLVDASTQQAEAKRPRLLSDADVTIDAFPDDIDLTLEEIRLNYGISIMEMMKKIQETRIYRHKATDFIRHLKCLRLLDVDHKIKFETARVEDFSEQCVIVSWSWEPSQFEGEPDYNCFIDGSDRPSDVRGSVWRRAAAYMQHLQVDYLWIDRECIEQDEDEKKEQAMRQMDLLYHWGSHPLGILTRPIDDKDDLHLLAEILRGDMLNSELSGNNSEISSQSEHFEIISEGSFDSELCETISEGSSDSELSGDTNEVVLKEGADERAWKGIELLLEITSDTWWKRAWIYQEYYRGGERMDLLMPHTMDLEELKAEHEDLFGYLEGELIISSVRFSGALTDLCSAFIRSTPPCPRTEVAQGLLSTAGRYSVLLKQGSSMSPTVIADVRSRDVTYHPDRIPIFANCCSYNVRLDKKALVKERCSHSLAILVSFLLNGEIFKFEPDERLEETVAPSDLTVIQFIQRYAFDRFSPPFQAYELTFIKSCRFSWAEIEADGVHTSGHLWKLWSPDSEISIPCRRLDSWNEVRKTLWDLHAYIEGIKYGKELASKLKMFLKEPRASPEPAASKYMWKMAETLAHALRDGQTLRLGYLCSSEKDPEWNPPTAIFISPDEAIDRSRSPYVFTASRPRKTTDGPGSICDVDKHVSLTVDVNKPGGPLPELKARTWIHGLWFWTKAPRDVVFPLPEVLSKL